MIRQNFKKFCNGCGKQLSANEVYKIEPNKSAVACDKCNAKRWACRGSKNWQLNQVYGKG